MKAYHLTYRLGMSHSADNTIEHKHKHVLEIEIYVTPKDEYTDFNEFGKIETYMTDVLNRYQGKYLNDIPEFGADASLEHTGETVYRLLCEEVERYGWQIRCFEISENPLRVYVIRDEDFMTRCF